MSRDEFYSVIGKDIVSRAVKAVSTPAFLYFRQLVRQRYFDLKACLPASFQIYYAMKANPYSELLKEFSSLGVGADVASLGELTKALEHGINPKYVEFSGPGKTEEEIIGAVRKNISSINAESMSELESIVRLSQSSGLRANVGLRINPRQASDDAGIKMSGDTQFGLPMPQVRDALVFIKGNAEAIAFTGLHVHTGSQILSSSALVDNFRAILELSLEIENMGILPIGKINFGGGWGIKYFANQTPLDLKQLTDGLRNLFNAARYSRLSQKRHIVEPGRFLVGECGLYVTSVLCEKPGISRKFLVVDGGMHHHYLLAGGMGQVIKRNFEVDFISTTPQANSIPSAYDVAGCLCTPQDILATNLRCDREIHVGDRIVFFNSGAYGLTASPVSFLSHKPPLETIV